MEGRRETVTSVLHGTKIKFNSFYLGAGLALGQVVLWRGKSKLPSEEGSLVIPSSCKKLLY